MILSLCLDVVVVAAATTVWGRCVVVNGNICIGGGNCKGWCQFSGRFGRFGWRQCHLCRLSLSFLRIVQNSDLGISPNTMFGTCMTRYSAAFEGWRTFDFARSNGARKILEPFLAECYFVFTNDATLMASWLYFTFIRSK